MQLCADVPCSHASHVGCIKRAPSMMGHSASLLSLSCSASTVSICVCVCVDSIEATSFHDGMHHDSSKIVDLIQLDKASIAQYQQVSLTRL